MEKDNEKITFTRNWNFDGSSLDAINISLNDDKSAGWRTASLSGNDIDAGRRAVYPHGRFL
jgi:hypothetical protein